MAATETKKAEPAVVLAVRKPYRSPELRRLGSVRELTLGPTVAGPLDVTTGRVKVGM